MAPASKGALLNILLLLLSLHLILATYIHLPTFDIAALNCKQEGRTTLISIMDTFESGNNLKFFI